MCEPLEMGINIMGLDGSKKLGERGVFDHLWENFPRVVFDTY